MPDVQVTTDPTAVFAIIGTIGALAVIAVIVSFRAARLPDEPDEPPTPPPRDLVQWLAAGRPAQPVVGAERSDARIAPSPTPPRGVAVFAIVGVIAALALIAIIVSFRSTEFSVRS